MRKEYARVAFEDPAKAEINLGRLEQQLAPTLQRPLVSLLANSPDPDGALNLLERFAQVASPEVLGDLARTPTALTYLLAIFGTSEYLAEAYLAEPELAVQFARDRNFSQVKSKEDLMQDYARFSTTHPDPWLSAQLARFKRRHYLRIALKDVLGISTLGETTAELSALADVILATALAFCDQELENRYGRPEYRDVQGRIVRSGFSIISLGKLGGNELNYSSDIDLLFLYSHDGETSGTSERESVISNKESFIRLAHAVTRTITQSTPLGHVFRVDLRLRPEGDQGDLAISVQSALEYYQHRARDWELQMLIKARHSAGEADVARQFLRGVEPSIYSSPADFAAIESVLAAREKISKKLRASREESADVKLHRGGIRDIEFLTQCLQRLQGGREAWVRSGGTLFALRKLNDKAWLSDADYATLTVAYEFLRKIEHRIQLEMGQQRHRLPTHPRGLDRLARRTGVESRGRESPGAALVHSLQETFARVDEVYQRVIHPRAGAAPGVAFHLQPLAIAGPEHGLSSYDSTLAFLDAQAPELAQVVRSVGLAERARKNLVRLFASLLSSSERFRLARQDPARLRRAIEVLAESEYFGEHLIHHPEDITALDSVSTAAGAAAGQAALNLEQPATYTPFHWVAQEGLDPREKMALLRREYRSRVVALGAADLAGLGSVFAALTRWSAVAGRAIATALEIAGEWLHETRAPQFGTKRLVVLGLGRLGLNEFDLASDADLIFVAVPDMARDEMTYCTRLAEKTIEVLSSYTRDGTVFAVDTRLRPQGREGELILAENSLIEYVGKAAQVWEALTYLKAAPLAGNESLGRETVTRLGAALLERFASDPEVERQLPQMRRRLERELIAPPSNPKTAPGGYYDVDFAISFLRLRHRVAIPPGANTLEQIAALLSAGALNRDDARTLESGATFLRTLDHALRLTTGKAPEGLPEHVGHADAVDLLVRKWGLVNAHESLARRLRETQQEVRYAYRRLVGSE